MMSDQELKEFGELLRKLRLKRNFSIKNLSDESGVSGSEISNIENAKRQKINHMTLRKLSEPLGVTYEYLTRAAKITSEEATEAEDTEEHRIAHKLRELDPRNRRIIEKMIDEFLAEEDS